MNKVKIYIQKHWNDKEQVIWKENYGVTADNSLDILFEDTCEINIEYIIIFSWIFNFILLF